MHRLRDSIVRIALGCVVPFAVVGCAAGAAAPPQVAMAQSAGSPSTVLAAARGVRPPSHPLARGAGWLSPAARSCKTKLYVSSFRLGYVSIYCTKGRNQAPIGQITSGINGPEGDATDAQGNLYVTSTDANTVTEYVPGTLTPSFTYTSGLSAPAGVTVDGKGNVYVSSISSGAVEVFPQGVNSVTLTLTGFTLPIDVALDKANDVYVTTYNSSFSGGEIIEFPPGSTQGTNLGITTKGPGGIELDRAGNIVTADQTLPGVLVFPPGHTSPSHTFGQNALDPDPVRLAPTEKRVYVGDAVGNAVYVYSYPGGALVDTITDGIDGPNGLALDPAAPQ
jgi:sugar lactone lactonase YvrE